MSPFKLVLILSVPINECPALMAALMRLSKLTSAVASPVVALPACVLPLTDASPLAAATDTLLLRILPLLLLMVRPLLGSDWATLRLEPAGKWLGSRIRSPTWGLVRSTLN